MSEFKYDVFLSHSSKDKPVVRDIAERLRKDGLKVWFDEWEIRPGDSIPAKIEDGLEHSRVFVLCMSKNVSTPDWTLLEAGSFRFRDPSNRERRFIPLRLDDGTYESSLNLFVCIDWTVEKGDDAYSELLDACTMKYEESANSTNFLLTPPIKLECEERNWVCSIIQDRTWIAVGGIAPLALYDRKTGRHIRRFSGHTSSITAIAFSNNGDRLISAADDKNLRLWDAKKGTCFQVFKGHKGRIWGLAWNTNQKRVLSASYDGSLREWDTNTGKCIQTIKGHHAEVLCVAWGAKGNAISGSGGNENCVREWDIKTGRCMQVFRGHTAPIHVVQWSRDRRTFLSGSSDKTARIWNVNTGQCLRVLEGHTDGIRCAAWHANNRHILSGSEDSTVRLWDAKTGICKCVLKGHNSLVIAVAWSYNGRHAISVDAMGNVRNWALSEFVTDTKPPKAKTPTAPPSPDQITYSNAKVLLVGDTGVGKTGLSNYIAHGIKVEDNKPLPSTDGAWATHWPLKLGKKKAGVEREIWLWDFAGQVDYRLVHQLYMGDAATAALIFNPQVENPFEALGHWDRDLQKATPESIAKLLVAGRVDRGGLVVSTSSMKKFMTDRGYLPPLHLTSAKTGDGCEELRKAIIDAIDWQSIPETTSPALYHQMKKEILAMRDSGLVLIRLSELKQRMEMTLRDESFELAELEAVIGLLSGPGMIQRLDFGGFILLRPEALSRYAAAVVRKVRKHPQEMGCISEDDLLAGKLDYQDFTRLPKADERVLLRALLETFVSRAWSLRQPVDNTAMLTFPSYFRRERAEQPSHPSVLVTYRFDGPADDIYATLVVLLHHTLPFDSAELWKSAADFKTQTEAKLGFTLTREHEGQSRLEVYFEPNVDENSRVLFLRYIHLHLVENAENVVRLRHFACKNKKCDSYGEQFTNQPMIDKAVAPGGKGKVFCPDCGKPIPLRDAIEKKFESVAVKQQAREMEESAKSIIDNESKELMAVHHTGFIVAEAGQVYRGYTNSDHGIDGEIEFKTDRGRASGKRLYVQLKSGDSYLKKRRKDGAEIFQIKKDQWATYWQAQAYPVMLVIRTSDEVIRWMDVSAYLKEKSKGGKKVKQIVFEGERLDVMSVRKWRKSVLG